MPDNVTIPKGTKIRRYYPRKRRVTVNVTVTLENITAELAEKNAGGVYQPVQSGSASAPGSITLDQSRAAQKFWRVTLSGPGRCNYSVATER